jgi:hypothetical protein
VNAPQLKRAPETAIARRGCGERHLRDRERLEETLGDAILIRLWSAGRTAPVGEASAEKAGLPGGDLLLHGRQRPRQIEENASGRRG